MCGRQLSVCVSGYGSTDQSHSTALLSEADGITTDLQCAQQVSRRCQCVYLTMCYVLRSVAIWINVRASVCVGGPADTNVLYLW